MRYAVAIIIVGISVAACSIFLLIQNVKDQEFKAVAFPFVQEIMARMEFTQGQKEVSQLCPAKDDQKILQRPTGFAVCATMHYDEIIQSASHLSRISIYLVFYNTLEDAKKGRLALGRTILEYDSSGLVEVTYNRW